MSCDIRLQQKLKLLLTPHSSLFTNEKKSEQAHILHAPTFPENAVYNEWQFQALGSGNRTKKGILLLKRIKSAFPVKMHIYTLCRS